MTRRHLALPRVWMLTDERMGEALWDAIARLPRGSGIIFRHYSLPEAERRRLFHRVRRAAFRRGATVAFSGPARQAEALGADAVYGRDRKRSSLPRLYPVHNRPEIVEAERTGAALLLLSPAFPTLSHPGGRNLGPARFGLLARTAKTPILALGGMTPHGFRRLRLLGVKGWAAIDAWVEIA